MNMVGPYTLRLIFQGFVVLVGALILSGAVNTAIVGANGVLNRMVEDGVLTTWFKRPHKRFGTSLPRHQHDRPAADPDDHRQPRQRLPAGFAVCLRRGVELLVHVAGGGGAALHQPRATANGRCPATFTSRASKIPVGLGLVSLLLFATAIINLFTKQMATIAGVSFSLVFFVILTISEKMSAAEHASGKSGLEQFNVASDRELSGEAMEVRPGNILVAVRDPRNLYYLQKVLAKTDTTKTDVVVMTSRVYHREHFVRRQRTCRHLGGLPQVRAGVVHHGRQRG